MESCYRMKPLILFIAMTVIGIIGIIGTVEYAHAITFSNYFEEIKVNTDVPYNVYNHGEPEQHITNACFVHYYFDRYTESERHFMSLNPYLEDYWSSGYTPITNITIEQDDKLTFHTEGINNTDSIKMTYPDGTIMTFETYTQYYPGEYERKENRFLNKGLRFLPIGTTTIEFIGPTNCFSNTITINVIESKEINKLKEKTNDKIERKNLWKERYNTCYDKKENIKAQLETTTLEFNQYKLDVIDEQNQHNQLLEDHETQITTLESNYNLLQQNLTDAEFTINKLKQEKAELTKQFEEVETELSDAQERIKELEG